MEKPILFVSGDGHFGPRDPQDYRPYLEARYHDNLAQLEEENKQLVQLSKVFSPQITAEQLAAIDQEGAVSSGGLEGAWDVKRRLKELDREGVAAEIVFCGGHQFSVPPFFAAMNNPCPPDLRAAGARAYHRWGADQYAQADGRIFGVAEAGPCLDMAATVRELQWCAEHGFVATFPPGMTYDPSLPPLSDRYFEPFWATCAELGLVIDVHAGYGQAQGKFWDFAGKFIQSIVGATSPGASGMEQKPDNMMQIFEKLEGSPFMLDLGPRRLIWQMMLGGVFDRHPTLKLAVTEARADWMPATLQHLDKLAASMKTPLKMKPSEYWARNCFAVPSSIHTCEMEMRDQIGVDQLIFATDYPHPEATWPNTKDWIRMTFKGVSEADARKILGENAIRCFGLDRAKIEKTAQRIGFKPSDVLVADPKVNPICLGSFDARAGMQQPPEKVNLAEIEAVFKQDVGLVA